MTVVPQFGVDPDLFRPAEQKTANNRRFTIGYIGRLVEEKGVHLLLDVLARIPGDMQLRVVGSGPKRDDLHRQAEHLGLSARIGWIDWVELGRDAGAVSPD